MLLQFLEVHFLKIHEIVQIKEFYEKNVIERILLKEFVKLYKERNLSSQSKLNVLGA